MLLRPNYNKKQAFHREIICLYRHNKSKKKLSKQLETVELKK